MSPEPRQKTVKTPQLANEAETRAHPSPKRTPSRNQSVSRRVTPLKQAEQKTSHQDQVSCDQSSPAPRTPTPTSRPAPVPRPTSSTRGSGSRDSPIEIASSEDESPSISIARRRRSASSKTSTPSGRPRPAPCVARPTAKIRSASDPLPVVVTAKRPYNSDVAIEDLIRGTAKIRMQTGFVYVLTAVHKGKHIVKIGHTTSSVERRVRQIEQTCRCIQFDRPSIDLPQPQIELHYMTVEKLAHIELRNFRYTFDCPCGKRHLEYFDVDHEVARHVVKRWIRFCEASPWDARVGQKLELKDEWRDRLVRWKKEHGRPSEDLRALPARWDHFVDALWWDWLWYDVRVWSAWLSRFWGQTLIVMVCMVTRYSVGDRGWLARLAEWVMLGTILRLGGFRSVAAKGVLEPLLEMMWTIATAVLRQTLDNHSRKVAPPVALVNGDDKDDDEDDWDGWDDRVGRDDGNDGKDEDDEGEDVEEEDNEEKEDEEEDEDDDDGNDSENEVQSNDKGEDMDIDRSLPLLGGGMPRPKPNNCRVTGKVSTPGVRTTRVSDRLAS
ncbi:hypothetical protein VTI74DRAFT_5219 [Chaetomium olivicolor]